MLTFMTLEVSSSPDENLLSRFLMICLTSSMVIGFIYMEWLTSFISGKGTRLIFSFQLRTKIGEECVKLLSNISAAGISATFTT